MNTSKCHKCKLPKLISEQKSCEAPYCKIIFSDKTYCSDCLFSYKYITDSDYELSGLTFCRNCTVCFCVTCSTFKNTSDFDDLSYSMVYLQNTLGEPGDKVVSCDDCLQRTKHGCDGCGVFLPHRSLQICQHPDDPVCLNEDNHNQYFCNNCMIEINIESDIGMLKTKVCLAYYEKYYRQCETDSCSVSIKKNNPQSFCKKCLNNILSAEPITNTFIENHERIYRIAQAKHYGFIGSIETTSTEHLTQWIQKNQPYHKRNWVVLKCVKVGSKLRIRFHCFESSDQKVYTNIYNENYNCRFPKALRKDGYLYCIPDTDISLNNSKKPYYSVSTKNIIILTNINKTIPPTVYTTPQCVVCLDSSSNIIAVPCGHQCVCSECFTHLGEEPKCPLCRRTTEHHITI